MSVSKNIKDMNFSANQLGRVLIIRSFSPILQEVIESVLKINPLCEIDILQAKGALVIDGVLESSNIKNIIDIKYGDGFKIRNLLKNKTFVMGKTYDAVIVLYGIPYRSARYFNVDVYSYFIPSLLKIAYDTKGNVYTLTAIDIIFGLLNFVFSYIVYFMNLIATCFLFVCGIIFLILLCPLSLFHKRK